MVTPNRYKYLASLADEFIVQATRVRDLIGDRHWLSDGHHKEYLLQAVLARHLPAGVITSRGFVVSSHDGSECSREQDLLIVDTQAEAPLHNQGGIIITFPSNVIGSISVKSALGSGEMEDSMTGADSLRQVAARDSIESATLWCGGFFLVGGKVSTKTLIDHMTATRLAATRPTIPMLSGAPPPVGLDVAATADDLLLVVDHESHDGNASRGALIRAYEAKKLSTALFLAALLDHIARRRGRPESSFREFLAEPSVKRVEA
jgi:hypothetical protein